MTSKECFVYLQLPLSEEVVTLGRIRWESSGANSDVGTFVYGKNYLARDRAFPLDPFQLPLQEREHVTTLNEGLPGPIRDASPDSWGRFGISKNPPAPTRRYNRTLDLGKLIAAAHKLEQDLPLDDAEKALLMGGHSAGGARPKTTVEHKNEL